MATLLPKILKEGVAATKGWDFDVVPEGSSSWTRDPSYEVHGHHEVRLVVENKQKLVEAGHRVEPHVAMLAPHGGEYDWATESVPGTEEHEERVSGVVHPKLIDRIELSGAARSELEKQAEAAKSTIEWAKRTGNKLAESSATHHLAEYQAVLSDPRIVVKGSEPDWTRVRLVRAAEFREEQHPRGPGGKWEGTHGCGVGWSFHGVETSPELGKEWGDKARLGLCPWCGRTVKRIHKNVHKHLMACPERPKQVAPESQMTDYTALRHVQSSGKVLCEVFALEDGRPDLARTLRAERLARDIAGLAVRAAQFEESQHPRGQGGRFIYYSPLRPVMSISHYLPKGWQLHGEVKNPGEHRTFSVPRHLTIEEVEQWELEPEDPRHPVNVKKAYAKFHDELMDKYAEKGALKLTEPDGRFMVLSETVGDERYPFRVTRFMADGTPTGHDTFRDFDEVSRHLFGYRNTAKIEAAEPDGGDVVKAARKEPEPMSDRDRTIAEHSIARDEARHAYQQRVNRVVASLEASAVADLKRKEEDEAKRKKRRDEELAAAALLLFLAGAEAYRRLYGSLAKISGVPAPPHPQKPPISQPAATATPSGGAGAVPGEPATWGTGAGAALPGTAEAADLFAASRAPFLVNFPAETLDKLAKVAAEAVGLGKPDSEVAKDVAAAAQEVEAGAGAVVAMTESQAAYGTAQHQILAAQFETQVWDQLDRPTKRDSHAVNMDLGEVPVGYRYPNGQIHPGDGVGGPAENANCLCVLYGVKRRPGVGHLQASEPIMAGEVESYERLDPRTGKEVEVPAHVRQAAKWVHNWSWKKGHGNMPSRLEAHKYLMQFKENKPIELHRFERADHDPAKAETGSGSPFQSWSRNKKMVESIVEDTNASPGAEKLVMRSKVFHPHQVYTDFTQFPEHFKKEVDKHGGASEMGEVLVWKGVKASEPVVKAKDADDTDRHAHAVLFRREGKRLAVLMTRDFLDRHEWSLPGGHAKQGETLKQGLVREIAEETGLDVKESLLEPCGSGLFCCELDGADDLKAEHPTGELRWVPVDELPNDELLFREVRQAARRLYGEESDDAGVVATRKRGLLIAFEGVDGAGKSTQIELLRERLEKEGRDVTATRWKSSPVLGQAIADAKRTRTLSPMVFSLLHAADLRWRAENDVRPALAEDGVVLADRWTPTSRVRDRLRGVSDDLLDEAYEGLPEPDLVVWLTVPVRVAVERIMADKQPHYYSSGLDIGYKGGKEKALTRYEEEMQRWYAKLAEEGEGWAEVKGDRPVEDVAADVWAAVEPLLEREEEKVKASEPVKAMTFDSTKHPHDWLGRWTHTYPSAWRPPEPVYKNANSKAVKHALFELHRTGEPAPRPVAGAIAVNEHGEVLLAHSNFSGQGWFFPKGGVDEGEDALAASRREASEEAGLELGEPVADGMLVLPPSEVYVDSLGFGSPRKETKGEDPRLSAGAYALLGRAAEEAGVGTDEFEAQKREIFDDLSHEAVRWASRPVYHVFAVRGRPGAAGPETEAAEWMTPEEAAALSDLHVHVRELLARDDFWDAVDRAAAKARKAVGKKVKATDAGAQVGHKFYGNQYVDVLAVTKTIQDALAHFQGIVFHKAPLTQLAADLLLKSRLAYKSVPWENPMKAELTKLGEQVVKLGEAAGVQYVGGGKVAFTKKPKTVIDPSQPPPGGGIMKVSKTGHVTQFAGGKVTHGVVPPPQHKTSPATLGWITEEMAKQGAPVPPELQPKVGEGKVPKWSGGHAFAPGHATPGTDEGRKLNQARVDLAAELLASGAAEPDAVLGVIDASEPGKLAFVKAIAGGPAAARALTEYRDTPRADLECLSAVFVDDKPVHGQACCYMADRRLMMGSTSVTGDFRHELGHALHGAMMKNAALEAHIAALHKEALAKAKANPAGMQKKLDHEFYETAYGVIGRRAMDDEKEDVAEHYRGYHKAVFRTRTGEDPDALKRYRERFPGWAKLWDAWYGAQKQAKGGAEA